MLKNQEVDIRPSYQMQMSYIGTRYFGWQSQPHGNTIQDHTESVLSQLLHEKVRLVGASRTDSGVHADQQVAVFRTQEYRHFPPQFLAELNQNLPNDIHVKSLTPAPPNFHPAWDAIEKSYRYQLIVDESPDCRDYPFHWRIYKPVDCGQLEGELAKLVGEFDFTSFSAADARTKNHVRTIFSIELKHSRNEITIDFRGDGFLKQMIRIIVGTALEATFHKRPKLDILDILAKKDRRAAGRTAPAQGLRLRSIHY